MRQETAHWLQVPTPLRFFSGALVNGRIFPRFSTVRYHNSVRFKKRNCWFQDGCLQLATSRLTWGLRFCFSLLRYNIRLRLAYIHSRNHIDTEVYLDLLKFTFINKLTWIYELISQRTYNQDRTHSSSHMQESNKHTSMSENKQVSSQKYRQHCRHTHT